MTRVLVTGSRRWPAAAVVYSELHELWLQADGSGLTVVHGACWKGADRMAAQWCARGFSGVIEEAHPADWRIGRNAGFIRNAQMANLGADVCLAFIYNDSNGARHCADMAEAAGIPTRRFIRKGAP